MTTLVHGGDWAGFESKFGRQPLDFSANISPLGLPEGVKRAVIGTLDLQNRYPDPLCRELCRAIAQAHDVPERHVLCGNGAADLIWRLTLAFRPRRALLLAPTFAEYQAALQSVDCQLQFHQLKPENGFLLEEDFLEKLQPGVDLVFLCEPNNPTGRTTSPSLLQKIVQRCAAAGIMLVVDECFNDFLDEPQLHTLEGELTRRPNLLVLKAFTKWYAMAGLRLGYVLCANEGLLERMRTCGQPWAVSGVAQAAGLAALQEIDYSCRLRQLIQTQRPFLADGLTELGCQVIPGEANYLLFHHQDPQLALKLQHHGILLRDCSNYPGLSSGWYRAAVRTREENAAFLQALKEVINQ